MNVKNHGSQRISFKNVFIQIDKISDKRARAAMEANVGTAESDGAFIIPGPGKRAVLRKTISFSQVKTLKESITKNQVSEESAGRRSL